MLVGVEMGGTKVVCGAGPRPEEVVVRERIPTTTPEETIGRVVDWIARLTDDHGAPEAVGVASFGPLERRVGHPRYGHITTTPKPGWDDTDVVGPIAASVDAPVGWDTDVTGAALGEYRHGAGRDAATLVYYTIGTGVGGGLLVDGRPTHGLGHPEMGHVRPRRDPDDEFPGSCPFHGDCLEGLVSGTALAARFGRPADEVPVRDLVEAVTGPLGAALADLVYTVAPERVVVGGGVGTLEGLHAALTDRLFDELHGYGWHPEHIDGFVVPPGLGDDAGLVGALCLAADALEASR